MALQKSPAETRPGRAPFEHVFSGLADEADARLWASVEDSVASRFALSARDDLRALLIGSLCGLCASVLYEGFVQSSVGYDAFVEDMTAGGLIRPLRREAGAAETGRHHDSAVAHDLQ